MTVRALVGVTLLAGYVGLLIHASGSTQCPARALGPCARVHQLLTRQRAPESPALLIAAPMVSRGELGTGPTLALAAVPVAVP